MRPTTRPLANHFSRLFAGWLALLAISVAPLHAQLPQPRLLTVFPPGGTAGATADVAITGAELDDAQLRFSHAGITTKALAAANSFAVTIGSGVPPGIYEARVFGRFGVSNPRSFVVGALPEVVKKGAIGSPETAQEIPLNCVVNGRTENQAADHYRVAVKKGQRVLIDCLAREIDSRMADSLLLLSPEGQELERARMGGLIDHTPSADGTLILKLHDFVYWGGDQYFYRLTVTTGPRLDFIFPPGIEPGKKSQFTLYGRNLPAGQPSAFVVEGKPLEQQEVEITAPASASVSPLAARGYAAGVDGFEYRLASPKGVSNPLFIALVGAPVIREREPNNAPDTSPQPIAPPCVVAGQFHPRSDADWFSFEAKKGDAFQLEVWSHQLGLPTEPLLLVQKANRSEKGEITFADVQELADGPANIGGPEFNTAHRDPVGRFEAKEDGSYRLGIRDLFGRTKADPRNTYLLSIRREAPDFRLVALPEPSQVKKNPNDVMSSSTSLRRGEVMPVKLMVLRRDGFREDITVTVTGLPAGVTASDLKIPAASNSIHLLLHAAEDAKPWFGPVQITGRARVGATELVREARVATVSWDIVFDNNTTEAPQSRLTRDFALAISAEVSPLTITFEQGRIYETCVADKLKIPVGLIRRSDYKAEVKLKTAGLKELEKIPELALTENSKGVQLVVDLTQHKLPPGTHSFYFTTRATGKYRQYLDDSKSAEDQAKAADKAAADAAAEAKKAADEAAKVTAPPEAKAAAQKAAAAAAARAKEAEAGKAAAQKSMKEMADKSKPRDLNAAFYSLPITLKVAPGPITMSEPPMPTLAPGARVELPLKISRQFNYQEAVEVSLVVPGSVKGISAAKVTIPKDGRDAKLTIETKPDATPGDHKLTLQAALKLNGQDLKIDQPFSLRISAAKP